MAARRHALGIRVDVVGDGMLRDARRKAILPVPYLLPDARGERETADERGIEPNRHVREFYHCAGWLTGTMPAEKIAS